MKALKLTKNKSLKLDEVEPPNLRKNHSIISIDFVGLCSSDIARTYSNGAYSYPLIIGHEAMGRIYQTSSKKFATGDRVIIFPLKPCFKCNECKSMDFQRCKNYSYYGSREDGALQQQINIHNWNLIKIDHSIKSADAALTEPTSVMVHVKNILFNHLSLHALKNNFGAVIGGGFLSIIFCKILHILDVSNHIVFERNKFKRSFAKEKNIHSIDSREIKKRKYKNFFKWVVEASGDPNSIENAIEICAPGGVIVLMSNIREDVKLKKDIFSKILRKELTVLGSWNSSFNKSGKSDWSEAIRLIKKGFSPSEFVTHNISLAEAQGIIERFHLHKIRKKKFKAIKALIRVSDDYSTSS